MNNLLKIIQNTKIKGNYPNDYINRELQNLIRIKTNDFKNPENISTKKIDITKLLINSEFDEEFVKENFGSLMRSEQDVVYDLAKRLKNYDGGKYTSKYKPKFEIGDKVKINTSNDIYTVIEFSQYRIHNYVYILESEKDNTTLLSDEAYLIKVEENNQIRAKALFLKMKMAKVKLK